MRWLLRRARCAVAGHPDTVVRWGGAHQVGTALERVIEERCCRCDFVLSRAIVRRMGERWTAA